MRPHIVFNNCLIKLSNVVRSQMPILSCLHLGQASMIGAASISSDESSSRRKRATACVDLHWKTSDWWRGAYYGWQMITGIDGWSAVKVAYAIICLRPEL